MISHNRGEWSELYGVLFLLVNPKLNIVNAKLETIDSALGLFILDEVISKSSVSLRYKIVNSTILIFIDDYQYNTMSVEEINEARQILIDNIKNATANNGAFEIPSLNQFLKEFSNNNEFKTGSREKGDIELILFDSKREKDINLSYSIKSSLGSPATILNSSKNTDVMYRVHNFDISKISEVNAINTRTKLLDRIRKIESLGGRIEYDSIPSPNFEYNLKMVDTDMPKYLGNTLLYSYKNNNKKLNDIFLQSNEFDDCNIAMKKLGDLISAISFGFVPGTKWDGNKTVTGGLIIIKDSGQVCLLDLIYFENEVNKFLINESKLDSPSSSRYHMLELFESRGNIYFTLNLQIRYKE